MLRFQDEKNQIITTNCWLNQAWIDHKLSWDPDEYGGLKVVRLPYDAIWRPDILLYNKCVHPEGRGRLLRLLFLRLPLVSLLLGIKRLDIVLCSSVETTLTFLVTPKGGKLSRGCTN